MNVCSLPFLAFCGLSAVVVNLLPREGQRRLFLSAINLAFLALLVPNKRSWACFFVVIGASYVALRWVKARPSPTLVLAIVSLSIASFVYLKQYTILKWVVPQALMPNMVELIGLSYMLFKFIHMLVDNWQGQLAPFTLASYANYQLSFFTLVAGPIQRYNDYQRSWEEMDLESLSVKEILSSWSRLLTGMIKVGAVAPLAYSYFVDGSQLQLEPTDRALGRFAECFYGYPVYMYFNFSGYTDIVIGAAGLLGFRLPENFNRPFLARNVIDYWNRWHISLSHWIRDYIFMPSYKAGLEHFPSWGRPIGYSTLFLSLFVAGIWHGSTANFAVFGAIHGLGAAVNQAYTDALKDRLGRERLKRYQKSRTIHWLAVLLTFHYICFAFLFFSLGNRPALNVIKAFVRRLFAVDLSGLHIHPDWSTAVPLIVVTLILLASWKRDALFAGLDRIGEWIESGTSGLYRVVLVKSVLVALLFISLWAWEQDPVVIYGRF